MNAALSASSLLHMGTKQIGRALSRQEQMKFLLTNVAPALIQPEEADRLIDYVIDESVLFNQATVARMTTNEKDIRFIDISGGVLRQATCGDACAESVTISNTNKCLRTVSLDAMFYLCDDDLEDGLTGAALEQQVMRMTADQMANELELWSLMSNTDGSYLTNAATSPVVVNNNVLGLRDGWYRELQQGHPLDAAGIAANRQLSFQMLRCLKTAIPSKYRRNMAQYRIYMPVDMVDNDFIGLHEARQTDLGDRAFIEDFPLRSGITPIVPVPMIPTDIQNCACLSLPSANGTFMFATEPSNLVLGIERNITFERYRVGCEHRTWYIWTVRVDTLVFNEDATALVDCMNLSDCGTECIPAALQSKCGVCIDTGTGGEPS